MSFADVTVLQSPTGAALAMRHAPSAAPSTQAIVLISHGLAEHAGRYQAFAEFLAARDYTVYAHDHRGHGETRAEGAPLGRFGRTGGAQLVIEDLLAVRNFAVAENPGLPVIVIGHSMGGMIAAASAEAYPDAFDGLAIWNSNLDPGVAGMAGRLLLKIERALKGSDVPSTYGPKLTFQQWAKSLPEHRTDFDWLNSDPREVDAYIADPLCGWDPSVSMWLDVLELAAGAGTRSALDHLQRTMPIQIIGGGQDPATSGGKAMQWLARRMASMGFLNTSLTLYPEMRHETLKERGRDGAMKTFAAWADGVVASEAGTP